MGVPFESGTNAGPLELATLLGMRPGPGGAGRAYAAYPNLSRARWLFPADRPAMRRSGIGGLFVPGSMRGRVFKGLMLAGVARGERVWLEEDALARLEAEVARCLGEREVGLAFHVGSPGAYRKVTAQVMSPTNEVLAYAKITASPLGVRGVEAEHRNLVRLSSEARSLRGLVPEVLGRFGWRGGEVLLLSSGPGRPGPHRLSRLHVGFCESVFRSFRVRKVFGESAMWMRMTRVMERLSASDLPGEVLALLRRALERLERELGPVSLPLSMAHRDFAPWNTRLGARGLFVFDWDHAKEEMVPLYDVFHFEAIQAALFGRRRYHPPERPFVRDALGDLWPEGREHLRSLRLAYLADIGLFYSEALALAPDVGERRVWRWFLEQTGSSLREGALR